MAGEAGKGSKQRPTDPQKFDDGWDNIWGKKKEKQDEQSQSNKG